MMAFTNAECVFLLELHDSDEGFTCAVTPAITDRATRRHIREDPNLQPVAYPGFCSGEGRGVQ